MDLEKTLKTCTKILIENNLNQEEVFKSCLDRIISENKILILAPTLNNRLYKLNDKEIYNMIFFCKNSPYSCKVKIKKYLIKDGLRVAEVDILSKLKQIQRRESYRLETTNLPLKFCFYDEKYNNANIIDDEIKFEFEGIVKDISTGGIKFNCSKELKIGDIIMILLKIRDNTIITTGNVLYFEKLSYEKYNYSYKLAFKSISSIDKKFLYKYIFEEQIKMAKKRNGLN